MGYGFDSNWAGLGALGTLARCIGCLDARTSAGLQWEWRHWCYVFVPSPGHTRHHVCVACSRLPSYQRTHITPGPDYTRDLGLTVLYPVVPSVARAAQSDRVLL